MTAPSAPPERWDHVERKDGANNQNPFTHTRIHSHGDTQGMSKTVPSRCVQCMSDLQMGHMHAHTHTHVMTSPHYLLLGADECSEQRLCLGRVWLSQRARNQDTGGLSHISTTPLSHTHTCSFPQHQLCDWCWDELL